MEPGKRHFACAHTGSRYWLVESTLFGDHVNLRLHWEFSLMLNAHLPTGSRQLAISPTADWEPAIVGRCLPNADPIVGANRRYSADSKFESALEPVGASR